MRVERALDNAWARRLVTYALLHRTSGSSPTADDLAFVSFERWPRSDPPTIDHLTATRRTDSRRSWNGRVNVDCAVRSTSVVRQHWIGRIDFVDDQLPFSVEIQSELFHGSVLDRRRDKERIAALRAGGHQVLEVWESDVWRNPEKVVQRRPRSPKAGRIRPSTVNRVWILLLWQRDSHQVRNLGRA